MSERIYANLPTGNTYYAKPAPLVAAPWADDVVSVPETSVAGWYASAAIADPADQYVLFLQAGGSPADTDTVVAGVEMGLPVQQDIDVQITNTWSG